MFLYYSIVLFVASFIVTSYLIPKIISVVQCKRLMDKPNDRSSHHLATPSLGGIAFFIVFVIALSFNNFYDHYHISMSILPALTVLFFVGLKDDLMALSAKSKLLGQMVACSFILIDPHFQLNSFHGFLGVNEIPFWAGILIGLVLMLGIINSFNLIDGIDGLASSVGILIFIFFSFVFLALDFKFLFLSAVSMIAILIGFLFFNLSKEKRIFMGDTGSMQIGIVIAIMTMRLLGVDARDIDNLPFESSYQPLILLAALILPVYDAIRVFIMRLLKGKSPFSAGRDHLHHLIIDTFEFSHIRASMLLVSFNAVFLLSILSLSKYFSLVTLIMFTLVFLVSLTIYCIRLENEITQKRARLEKKTLKIKWIKYSSSKNQEEEIVIEEKQVS